jgi:hypothetical protein
MSCDTYDEVLTEFSPLHPCHWRFWVTREATLNNDDFLALTTTMLRISISDWYGPFERHIVGATGVENHVGFLSQSREGFVVT